MSAHRLQSTSWGEKWVGGGIWECARAKNGLNNAQPSSSTSVPSCLQLSQLLGRMRLLWGRGQSCSSFSPGFGKAWKGLAQKYPILGICILAFAVSVSGKQRSGWEFSDMTGRLPRALRRESAHPALPSPALGLVFPFFHHSASPRPWGSSGCVCSSGDDPNSCTWCTERSQARGGRENHPGISKIPWDIPNESGGIGCKGEGGFG